MSFLRPKRVKYLKQHLGHLSGIIKTTLKTLPNEYFIISKTAAWITAKQIEMLRLFFTKRIKKIGKFQFLIFPDRPISKKSMESRMGSGKGNVHTWAYRVKRNTPILKFFVPSNIISYNILNELKYKLPVEIKLFPI